MHSSDSEVDDAGLVWRVQFGSPQESADAMRELVLRYGAQLERHVWTKGLAYDERQDVCNDVWKRAWQQIAAGRYRDQGVGILPWLRGIANNVIRETNRDRYIRIEESDSSDGTKQMVLQKRFVSLEIAQPTVDGTSSSPDHARQVVDSVVLAEAKEAIKAILEEATEDFRTIIDCWFFAEFSTEEIIQYTGWSQSKVYTTKFRALEWLRERLPARYGEEAMVAWQDTS